MENFHLNKFSQEYPPYLKHIHQPPRRLYLTGCNLWVEKSLGLTSADKFVAMVGTRLPSRYGERMAYEIARAIVEKGGIIVSGLAFGIDAICHRAAVEMKKPTVGVLASGIGKITPSSHTGLAADIIRCGGAIISEYDDTEPPLKHRFLMRNRIISGICKSTIVIEAGERSGALITARHAFDQNREVFVLTGDIDRPQTRGCLDLIARNMAKPVTSIKKLLEELGFQKEEFAADISTLTVMRELAKKPLRMDEIMTQSKITARDLNVAISKLEVGGRIVGTRDGRWKLVN